MESPAAPAAVAAAATATAAALALRQYMRALRAPRVLHANTRQSNRLLLELLELLREHWPHALWEMSGEISSAAMLFRLPPIRHGARESELVGLPDGGTVRLDWEYPREGHAEARGIVLLLPGLNNSSASAYIQHAMGHLCREGFSAVCLDYRGVGGLPLTSPRFGCADSWRDLPTVCDAIRRFGGPHAPILAIGFSMGGSVLAKYLSASGSASQIRAGVTVSSPFALTETMRSLEADVHARMFNLGLTLVAKLTFVGHTDSRPHLHGIDWRALATCTTLRGLEEATICRLHGYPTAEDYYEANRPDFGAVRTPLLCLHAEDDPVIRVKDLPLGAMRANPRVIVAITRHGGHLGWTGGPLSGPWAPTWSDVVCAKFLSQFAAGGGGGGAQVGGRAVREAASAAAAAADSGVASVAAAPRGAAMRRPPAPQPRL